MSRNLAKESDEQDMDEEMDEDVEENDWSKDINRREDVEFQESSVWYPVTREEMKAWVSLYLNMGLITKPNLSSYWSTDPALSSLFFPAIMSRVRFFQILRYLHFADNIQAPQG